MERRDGLQGEYAHTEHIGAHSYVEVFTDEQGSRWLGIMRTRPAHAYAHDVVYGMLIAYLRVYIYHLYECPCTVTV